MRGRNVLLKGIQQLVFPHASERGQIFFYYNYLNNFNFNNKIDKIKNLKIQMTEHHYQWRVAKTPLTVMSFFVYFSVFS
jgi:hypothetical protein